MKGFGSLTTTSFTGKEVVELKRVEEGLLLIKSTESLSYTLDEISYSLPIGKLPFYIELPNRSTIEVKQTDENKAFVASFFSSRSKFIQYLEQNIKATFAALGVIVLVLFFLFKYGVPAFSTFSAERVPLKYLDKLDDILIEQVISQTKESELDEERREKLEQYFRSFTNTPFKLIFVKGGPLKANAFALSGKTIIFTDEIIELMDDDKKLLAIFFHEMGHLKYRHVAQNVINSATVAAFSFFALGDIQGIVATLGTVGFHLMSLGHSREFEKEADKYAVYKLREKNISRSCFIEGIESLSKFYKMDKNSRIMHYFSSHPNINRRIESIEDLFEGKNRLPCSF